MSLSWELSGSPSLGDTFESVSLGDGDNIDVIREVKDSIDRDELFKERDGKVDFLWDGSTVDLDFGDVSLLLSETDLSDLGVS